MWVLVKPEREGQINECFLIVRNKVTRSGGSILHGWTIAERPGLFIEAEFHAVWLDNVGTLLDVTPRRDRIDEILFLPDPTNIFDEDSLVRRDNVRLAEYDHPIVHEFLRHAEKVRMYEESCTNPNNPREMILDRDIYEPMLSRCVELEQAMIALRPERNSMCRCGSAKKFKHCCGGNYQVG